MSDKKIGIASGCRKLNYGSLLQSYALCESIKKLGYECNFVWVKGNLFKHYNIRIQKLLGAGVNALKHPILIAKIAKSIYRIFMKQSSDMLSDDAIKYFDMFKKNYLYIKMYKYADLKQTDEYSAYVCGSDQIWNTYDVWLDPVYFLNFTKNKVAYAPSLGTDSISKYNKNCVKKYLKNFDYISIREESGARVLSKLLGRKVPFVLDPTLLLSKEEWINKLGLTKTNENYCLVYFLDEPSAKAKSVMKKMRETIELKTLPLNLTFYTENEKVSAGPREFLNLLYNARYIITDSFHGTILSVNFEKHFLTFPRHYQEGSDQSSRLLDILKIFDLSNFYINTSASIEDMLKLLNTDIEYDKVKGKLDVEKKYSINFLSTSISNCINGRKQ